MFYMLAYRDNGRIKSKSRADIFITNTLSKFEGLLLSLLQDLMDYHIAGNNINDEPQKSWHKLDNGNLVSELTLKTGASNLPRNREVEPNALFEKFEK